MTSPIHILIETQKTETISSLDSDELLSCLKTIEVNNDLSVRLCERLSFLIFQETSFGLLKIEKDHIWLKILTRIGEICEQFLENQSDYNKGAEWFAGHSCSSSEPNHTKERLLHSSIVSSHLLERNFLETLGTIESNYGSVSSLAQKLLNNDERCLVIIIVLLSHIDEIPHSSVFHPSSLFFAILNLIDFDCQVIIDWLTSELVACSLILRVLKSTCNPNTVDHWKNVNIGYKKRKVLSAPSRPKWKIADVECKPKLVLKVVELIGEQKMEREYRLTGSRKRVEQKFESLEDVGGDMWGKWMDTVEELGSRLEKLKRANLIANKFDVIVKWCEKFCDLYNKH